ncbi:HesA/MoeB/ThiF family protein [Thermosipho atlanticus]|uniref:Molybdopterin or thiamine biosynthesis adenylyltransferase n=1 Tax=Thermosipho atlanticus DSM 15807 TaxID=1123380 RepID=A0A1M5QX56_9BACT|nr:HesA/MoeB/ThiF family protein [Thermosipho atlanticus]SHH18682.1 Molybdopterin or thiamine biosynthesis adenylyltransferase [Thermosipho atlanticus DSM 15807]
MLDVSRHIKLYQKLSHKIKNSNILVAGAGGLGSTVLQNLVRIGFKNITIYDPKEIDPPDLNRQILFDSTDIGKSKVQVAKEKLLKINPECNIDIFPEKITKHTKLNKHFDIIFDCLDNTESRFDLDELSLKYKVPLIHGSVEEYRGEITVIYPGITKSLKEIFLGYYSTQCWQVIPPTVLIAASFQVSEGLKILEGNFEDALLNKILFFDILHNDFEIINVKGIKDHK